MSDDEYKEPWRCERTQEYPVIVDQEESTVAIPVGNLTDDREYAIEETRLRRIAACVNACAGIPTERLLEVDGKDLRLCVTDFRGKTVKAFVMLPTEAQRPVWRCTRCGVSGDMPTAIPSAVISGLCTQCANLHRGSYAAG